MILGMASGLASVRAAVTDRLAQQDLNPSPG